MDVEEDDNSEKLIEGLANCSREELIEKIRKLSVHVKQLRNVIRRDGRNADSADRPEKRARKERPFDFSKHPKRHVALKIAYLGWDYQGLAVQDDTNQTIEGYLFDAFLKAKLIESRSTSNYNRCGRTDKGVSAFSQVISIDFRCKSRRGKGVIPLAPESNDVSNNGNDKMDDGEGNEDDQEDKIEDELDYCKMLNGILPKEIRVLAWAPVRPDFSARFDCDSRTYKYFIPKGNIDIEAIRLAGSYLIGEYDFQNFCKMDNSAPDKTTMRRIISFHAKYCDDDNEESSSSNKKNNPYNLIELQIHGRSFLWHQIRCIVTVLILVGQGKEKPEVVKELLDLTKTPKKPQYAMASDYPLVLFSTTHGEEITNWICHPENFYYVMADLQTIWAQHEIKARMILEMIKSMENDMKSRDDPSSRNLWIKSATPLSNLFPANQLESLIVGTKTRVYKNLLERPVCSGKTDNNNSKPS